jgi:CTP:molybdopterin cytidylyltransferase MocA
MTSAGLLLAAGRSSRFGPANKLLAPFRGAPLVTHAAGALAALPLDHRLAVTADARVASLLPGFRIVGADPAGLQSDSLKAGLRAAGALGADLVLVALADMPLVTPDLLSAVLDAARGHGIAAAVDGDLVTPPAAFAADRFPALLALSGDRGAGALLRGLPSSARVPAPGLLADIDTEGDLAALTP